MIDSGTVLFATLGLLCPALLHYQSSKRRATIHHPPSPKSFPIVGNLFSLPSGMEHIVFMKLGEQLNSDIIYLRMLNQKIVVLNSAAAASELLDKRSALYSDRPCPPMFKEPALVDWAGMPSLVGYNDEWRHYRRLMNNWLNTRSAAQFGETQEMERDLLLKRLLEDTKHPELFKCVKGHLCYSMASSIFQLGYGYHLEGPRDPTFVNLVQSLQRMAEAFMFSNFLVNLIPSLVRVPDWFPGAGWKRRAKELRKEKEQLMDEPYQRAKSRSSIDSSEPSILGSLLQGHKLMAHLSQEEKDRRLKELAMIMYIAGTDTSTNVLVNFIAAVVLNPEVQAKAQHELDTVLGHHKLPTMADRARLPYINKIILEVMRWRPVLPMGFPHACFSDDVYRGYNIEKGTMIMGNVWAMSRDESIYTNPEDFNPDRFSDPNVPPLPGFGWGRRKCPGIYFAEASLFITISSLLATFTFSRKKDAYGNEITPHIEGESNALVFELKPFEFELQPRSEEHSQLILEHNRV